MLILALGIAWMAGLNPSGQGLQPTTGVLDLMVPFVLSGIGIGLAIAPTTSAVMATAPMDRVGNASGVLSTVRQLGSLMGIAVLGAVLQNRLVANVTAGVDAIPGLPEQARQMIVEGVEGGRRMSAPEGLEEQAMAGLFERLFQGWYTDAVNTTFIVAAAICVVGAVAAIFIRARADRPLPSDG